MQVEEDNENAMMAFINEDKKKDTDIEPSRP